MGWSRIYIPGLKRRGDRLPVATSKLVRSTDTCECGIWRDCSLFTNTQTRSKWQREAWLAWLWLGRLEFGKAASAKFTYNAPSYTLNDDLSGWLLLVVGGDVNGIGPVIRGNLEETMKKRSGPPHQCKCIHTLQLRESSCVMVTWVAARWRWGEVRWWSYSITMWRKCPWFWHVNCHCDLWTRSFNIGIPRHAATLGPSAVGRNQIVQNCKFTATSQSCGWDPVILHSRSQLHKY